jgi:hypothetical protein
VVTPAGLALGALLMLTIIQTGVIVAVGVLIGGHVIKTITEAGKRAVDARLGPQKRKKQQ